MMFQKDLENSQKKFKIHKKHLCQSLFSIKLQAQQFFAKHLQATTSVK